MAFTVQDYHEMVRLLREHPELQVELRQLLLPDDLAALSAIVRDLAEAQRRTEEQLAQLTARVDDLIVRMEQLTARVDDLAVRMEQLTARVDGLAARMEELAEAQRRTEERLGQLAADVRALTGEVRRLVEWQRGEAGRREGERYEQAIARSAPLLFSGGDGGTPDASPVYQRMVKLLNRLPNLSELTEEQNPLLADLIWWKDGQFVVAEVSLVVNARDVARAARRAETLRQAGEQAMGMVIGREWLDEEVRRRAEAEGVEWRVGKDLSEGYLAFCRRPG